MIISFNGIERIGKQYYSSILNNYLKEKYGFEHIKKFSFPSYTTQTGKKLAALIKRFRALDLLKTSELTKARYRKIAELMLENYQEYYHYIELHNSTDAKNISIVNNNYYSVIAHWMSASMDYKIIERLVKTKYKFLTEQNIFAIFLVTNDVNKVLTEPPKTHEIYINKDIDNELSTDYINFYKQVDNYYRQMFITFSFSKPQVKTCLIEVDMASNDYITKTVASIKEAVNGFLQTQTQTELESPNPAIVTVNKK